MQATQIMPGDGQLRRLTPLAVSGCIRLVREPGSLMRSQPRCSQKLLEIFGYGPTARPSAC